MRKKKFECPCCFKKHEVGYARNKRIKGIAFMRFIYRFGSWVEMHGVKCSCGYNIPESHIENKAIPYHG